MDTTVIVQMTEKGLLIPRDALGDLETRELEAVREEETIVIRPKSPPDDERAQLRQALRAAGLLYEPGWEAPTPVPPEERARLARKLAQGQPLSEMIIADREDRV
jgi:hypothetical protein